VGKSNVGSGPVSAFEQADIAYEQMRRALVKFSEVESEMHARLQRGDLTPTQENILIGRMNGQRDRIMIFAAVYHVERDVERRQRSGGI
jgi:hypothetical protein